MKVNTQLGDNRIFDNINTLKNEDVNIVNENEGVTFISELKKKLDEVNDDQVKAEAVTESFIKGDDVDIHQVMLVNEEAKLSLQMAVQVRNKLVEAYQELNRMQL